MEMANDLRQAESWSELDGVLNRKKTMQNLYKMGYRKLSENVIELPCKVGDTVYMPWVWCGVRAVAILTVTHIIIDNVHSYIRTDLESDDTKFAAAFNSGKFDFRDFGKKVFTNKEEADKALESL